jgi:DNA-binding MarR family transcriptional regulator
MTTAISTFFLIQQINRLIVKRVDELLKQEGSSSRQFLILDMLATHEPCSSAELARKGHMTAQAMGEALKSLQERGLLERSHCTQDGRKLLIQRSAAGRQAFIRCNRLVRESEAAMFACLQKGELARVRGGLALVREIEIAQHGGDD